MKYHHFLQKYVYMDKYLLRVKASFLADFYMGVERIFKIIAVELNGGTPKGEDWHKRLLLDMSINIGGRNPVISKELYGNLLKFLGFRHIVRQIYGFELDEKKLDEIASIFESVMDELIREIKKFCGFLQDQAENGK